MLELRCDSLPLGEREIVICHRQHRRCRSLSLIVRWEIDKEVSSSLHLCSTECFLSFLFQWSPFHPFSRWMIDHRYPPNGSSDRAGQASDPNQHPWLTERRASALRHCHANRSNERFQRSVLWNNEVPQGYRLLVRGWWLFSSFKSDK